MCYLTRKLLSLKSTDFVKIEFEMLFDYERKMTCLYLVEDSFLSYLHPVL